MYSYAFACVPLAVPPRLEVTYIPKGDAVLYIPQVLLRLYWYHGLLLDVLGPISHDYRCAVTARVWYDGYAYAKYH